MTATQRGRNGRPWRRLTQRVRRQQAPCHLCGHPIDYTLPPGHPDSFTVDHIQPLKLHPNLAHDYNNLAASHRRCNSSKGTGNRPTVTNSRDW